MVKDFEKRQRKARDKGPRQGPFGSRATGRPGVPGRPPKKRKMPVAARGKTTKKEGTKRKIKKVLKSIVMGAPTGLGKRPKLGGMADGGDLAKMIKTSGRIDDKDKARTNKSIMDLARKLKPTGRLSTTDLARARAAFKMARKGQKPVLDSKGKPVKNLTQKAGPGKPMSADQKKQLRRFKDVLKGMPKRPKRKRTIGMPLMGTAAKGMRKGFGGKNLKSAAKKLKRIM